MVLNQVGRMVQDIWDGLSGRFPGVRTDAFVIMPNHVHRIIVLVGAGQALPNNIADYYERIGRGEEELNAIREYILNNPLRNKDLENPK